MYNQFWLFMWATLLAPELVSKKLELRSCWPAYSPLLCHRFWFCVPRYVAVISYSATVKQISS